MDSIHYALNRLSKEGFVRSEGRRGTFVSHHPPHLFQYAVVFEHNPGDGSWTRFHDSIVSHCRGVSHEAELRFKPYFGIHQRPRADESANLINDLHNQCLRGVIYVGSENIIEPLLTEQMLEVPSVTIAKATSFSRRVMDCIWVDYRAMLGKAMQELQRLGRKRVAVIALGSPDEPAITDVDSLANEHNLLFNRAWYQSASMDAINQASQSVMLLMSLPSDSRPDGIIVADDNLVHQVGEGLVRSGVSVGQEVDVFSHANFPDIFNSPLPFNYVGFDVSEIIERCLQSLLDQESAEVKSVRRVDKIQPLTLSEYQDSSRD